MAMYAVIYRFEVKEGEDETFVEAWAGLTRLIHQYEASLGSRLHKENEGVYIAYAQWPNADHFKNAGGHMPPEAEPIRQRMRESCSKVETLHEMEMLTDLLVQ